MKNIYRLFGSFLFAGVLVLAPTIASAENLGASAHAKTRVGFDASGMVRVIGADVISVSGNVIDAVTTLGTNVINWVVTVSADTKIAAGGSTTASTTGIAVGDKVSFAGSLSSGIGSTIDVAAHNVRDLTTNAMLRLGFGTVTAVTAADNSFTVQVPSGKTVTVQTSTSTIVMLDGAASTVASISPGDKVFVAGSVSADGSIITASRIAATDTNANAMIKKDKKESDDDEDADASSSHSHPFDLDSGFHLGLLFGDKK